MKMWSYQIIWVLCIIAGVALLVWPLTYADEALLGLRFSEIIGVSAIAAIILSAICLWNRFRGEQRSAARVRRFLFALVLTITAANSIIFMLFLPKYNFDMAYKTLQAKPELELYKVTYQVGMPYAYKIEGNPFVDSGYVFFAESIDYSEREFTYKTHCVNFNPVTGGYQFGDENIKLPFKTETVIPLGDLESFSQDAVFFVQDNRILLNLFIDDMAYRDVSCYYDTYSKWISQRRSDAKPRLGKDDVAQLLNDLEGMGEKEVETKMRDCVQKIDMETLLDGSKSKAKASDITVDVNLYGLHIGTYRDGNITLLLAK